MSHRSHFQTLLPLAAVLFISAGCEGRLGLDLKGVTDTAFQDSGVGPSDTGIAGGGGDTNDTDDNTGGGDTNDTNDSGGGSTSPAAMQSDMGFEVESWRDVMWRTRKSRRRGL